MNKCPVTLATHEEARPLVVLGFDYGEKRMGVAVGQIVTRTASPIKVLKVKQQRPDWDAISQLLDEWQPDALILGKPGYDSPTDQDTEHPLTSRIEKFARQLQGRYHLPVYLVNEQYSSVEAESRLGDMAHDRDQLDAVAAQVIVETWLHEQDNE